jgi:hypothetical protein
MNEPCAKCPKPITDGFIQFLGARYHVRCTPPEVERYLGQRAALLGVLRAAGESPEHPVLESLLNTLAEYDAPPEVVVLVLAWLEFAGGDLYKPTTDEEMPEFVSLVKKHAEALGYSQGAAEVYLRREDGEFEEFPALVI